MFSKYITGSWLIAAPLHLPDEALDGAVLVGDFELRQVDVGRVEGEPHRETELRIHQQSHLEQIGLHLYQELED